MQLEKLAMKVFGFVHQIIHKGTQQIFAAKTLIKKEDENIFLRELKILSDLKHPAIEKFIGYSLVDFNKESCLVIVTKYMENQSLDKLLKEEPDCLANTVKLINIYGNASAIDYLHSFNILLDIKLNNILENDFLFPKVCNFFLSLKIFNNQEKIFYHNHNHKKKIK